MYSHTKKGVTLVELIVAMTLMSIFAVLCVMLINPIERTYKSTVKLARAQLLADTIVDSIRKECDDVKHDDSTDVWITNLSGDDDKQLLSNTHAANLSSGNTLVFRRNNNYTEAIYAAVKISEANQTAVANNPLTPEKTAHSIDTLVTSGSENMNSGIVHFGYYQAKEDDEGVFPIKPYDYTNPVMAKTYGDFTVTLNFSNLKLKDGKYPAYVMCKVSVLEKGKEVYTRSAVLAFAANGSGKGSGGGHTPSTKKDIDITVRWVDSAGNEISWPTAVASVNITFNGTSPARTHTLANGLYRFKFVNVTVSGSQTLTCQEVQDFICSSVGDANKGFVVTYKQKAEEKTVKLMHGEEFIKKIGQNSVTGVVFGKIG